MNPESFLEEQCVEFNPYIEQVKTLVTVSVSNDEIKYTMSHKPFERNRTIPIIVIDVYICKRAVRSVTKSCTHHSPGMARTVTYQRSVVI
ncbi:MAG: hypothetical protein ABJQ14_00345 [Hyphomicrobiales bacterium]